VLLALAVIVAIPSVAQAAPGDLDTTYGVGGIATAPVAGSGAWPKGVVLAGDNAAALRYETRPDGTYRSYVEVLDANGSPNAAFSGDGIVDLSMSPSLIGLSIASVPDGGFVVVGYTLVPGGTWFVARYDAGGNLDNAFGVGGVAQFSTSTFFPSIAVSLPDGRFAVGGQASNGADAPVAIVMLTGAGSLDGSYGSSGIAAVKSQTGNESARPAALALSGSSLVVVGKTTSFPSNGFVARLNASGVLDASFGSNGIAIVTTDGSSYNDALVAPDGKVTVVGRSGPTGLSLIRRIDQSGLPDPTFSGDGTYENPFLGVPIEGIAPADSGRFYTVVSQNVAGVEHMVLRLHHATTGVPDTSFGAGGIAVGPRGAARGVGLQSDGKPLIWGEDWYGAGSPLEVARFFGTVIPDTVPPAIVITSPAVEATIIQYSPMTTLFSCSDAGSGIATCSGMLDGLPINDGDPLPTSDLGGHVLTVMATDVAGNSSSLSLTYTVFAPVSAPGCEPLENLARWDFDSVTSPLSDRTSFGRDLTAVGSPTFVTRPGTPPSARALQLDRGDYVRFQPRAGDAMVSYCLSIDFWIRARQPLALGKMFQQGRHADETIFGAWGPRVERSGSGRYTFTNKHLLTISESQRRSTFNMFASAWGAHPAVPGYDAEFGQRTSESLPRPGAEALNWRHVTVTYGAAEKQCVGRGVKYYVDGVYADGWCAQGSRMLWSPFSPLTIGFSGDLRSNPFEYPGDYCDCEIDDVSIYRGLLR
jgi:uncharacterized delta-60 repeat protein